MNTLSQRLYRFSSWHAVLLTAIVYALFMTQVMVPHAVETQRLVGDWGAPDGHLYYTPAGLYAQLDTWSAAGREHYVHFRLTLDPLWALAYTAFLVTALSAALRKATPVDDPRRKLNLAPLIPMVADLIENVIGIGIVSASPERIYWLAGLMGTVSLLKWVTLAIAHVVLLYALLLIFRSSPATK